MEASSDMSYTALQSRSTAALVYCCQNATDRSCHICLSYRGWPSFLLAHRHIYPVLWHCCVLIHSLRAYGYPAPGRSLSRCCTSSVSFPKSGTLSTQLTCLFIIILFLNVQHSTWYQRCGLLCTRVVSFSIESDGTEHPGCSLVYIIQHAIDGASMRAALVTYIKESAAFACGPYNASSQQQYP